MSSFTISIERAWFLLLPPNFCPLNRLLSFSGGYKGKEEEEEAWWLFARDFVRLMSSEVPDSRPRQHNVTVHAKRRCKLAISFSIFHRIPRCRPFSCARYKICKFHLLHTSPILPQSTSDLYHVMCSYDSFPMHVRLVANALSDRSSVLNRDCMFAQLTGFTMLLSLQNSFASLHTTLFKWRQYRACVE